MEVRSEQQGAELDHRLEREKRGSLAAATTRKGRVGGRAACGAEAWNVLGGRRRKEMEDTVSMAWTAVMEQCFARMDTEVTSMWRAR